MSKVLIDSEKFKKNLMVIGEAIDHALDGKFDADSKLLIADHFIEELICDIEEAEEQQTTQEQAEAKHETLD